MDQGVRFKIMVTCWMLIMFRINSTQIIDNGNNSPIFLSNNNFITDN